MHELRRPLQALALLDGAEGGTGAAAEVSTSGRATDPGSARQGLLELARGALAELDGEVNGRTTAPELREVSCRELLHAALERWRVASQADGGIKLYWDAGRATVFGDPIRISQALDNLLANAIEHGGPPVVVTGARVAGRLRITVANGLGEGVSEVGANGSGSERPGDLDPRRGHGTELVSAVAADHRGRFALCHTGSGSVAALELPLTDGGLVAAA